MSLAPGWRRLLRLPLGTRRVLERDVDDELSFHLAMREEKLRALGVPDGAARAAAMARFGDTERVRDACLTIDQQFAREVRVMEWLESVIADLRYALRSFRRAPTFTLVASLTLALGIGATTAVFSVVDGILLRPLPFPDPDRVVSVLQSYPEKGLDTWRLSPGDFAYYAERQHVFSSFAASVRALMTLTGVGHPEQVQVTRVTRDFFKVLGVSPLLGRTFLADEDVPNHNHVAILSHGFWQRRFGGDASIVGETIDLDGFPTRVVGVMRSDYTLSSGKPDVWMPAGLDLRQAFGWNIWGIGRLAPGVTVATAQRELTAILWSMAREEPALISRTNPPPPGTKLRALVTPEHDALIGQTARPLVLLQSAVLLILLIAGANVATLLLGRAASRSREIALRAALGANGRRVVRQLLTESVALSLIGAVLGIGLAEAAVRLFPRLPVASLPRASEIGVNGAVLAFALGISIATGVLFGLVPALQSRSAGAGLASRLGGGGGQKGSASRSARRVNSALVVTQLAASIVLLIGAGLMLKSVHRLLTLDFGFRPDGVVNVSLPLPQWKYDDAKIEPFTRVLLEHVRALPGVANAAVTWGPPFWGSGSDGYSVEGHESAAASGDEPQTITAAVSPGYFATLDLPIHRGRDFDATDRDSSLQVVIVDEALARRFWLDGNAIGHRIELTGDTTWRTIVGVVGAIRDNALADAPMPHTYFPYAQAPGRFVNLIVRLTGDRGTATRAVLNAIGALDPTLPLDTVQPLTDTISQSVTDQRLTELLLGTFAVLALVLAAVGIYGVMSLFVTSRTREFGIRLAVGAEPASLVRLVLTQGAVLAGLGVVVGIGASLMLTRWMKTLLYDVSTTDPTVFVALPSVLIAIALLSCVAPAKRAAGSDPLEALNVE